ncbi:hypothetical protein TWF481_008311 [Arthrobotrys musiformis]|uniref:Uncharacterized protein n=1 Tax=Arthrobotrys musiformis TaxID=47236 RepID=A0AAV9W6S2_9PEZI
MAVKTFSEQNLASSSMRLGNNGSIQEPVNRGQNCGNSGTGQKCQASTGPNGATCNGNIKNGRCEKCNTPDPEQD